MDNNQTPAQLPAQLPQPNPNSQMLPVFGDLQSFESAQRIAKALAGSTMVPTSYQNNVSNCLVAMELSNRINMSVFAVMQNMHMIDGKPTWAANFLVASINTSGKFTPLRYEFEERGAKDVPYFKKEWVDGKEGQKGFYKNVPAVEKVKQDLACRAVATDKSTGQPVKGPWISLQMAIEEGWFHRKGSKWPNMLEIMLQYRAASFFSRIFAPEISLGMHTPEEVYDSRVEIIESTPHTAPVVINEPGTVAETVNKAAAAKKAATKANPVQATPEVEYTEIEDVPPPANEAADDAILPENESEEML